MTEGKAGAAEDAWSHYQRRRDDLVELRRSVEDVAETAYSPDGLVRATVGARGQLTELSLDPRIYRTADAAALAGSITATIEDAVAAATARIVELSRPFVPDGTDISGSAPPRLDRQLD
jgi:DNA-binding protein YbaB